MGNYVVPLLLRFPVAPQVAEDVDPPAVPLADLMKGRLLYPFTLVFLRSEILT